MLIGLEIDGDDEAGGDCSLTVGEFANERELVVVDGVAAEQRIGHIQPGSDQLIRREVIRIGACEQGDVTGRKVELLYADDVGIRRQYRARAERGERRVVDLRRRVEGGD